MAAKMTNNVQDDSAGVACECGLRHGEALQASRGAEAETLAHEKPEVEENATRGRLGVVFRAPLRHGGAVPVRVEAGRGWVHETTQLLPQLSELLLHRILRSTALNRRMLPWLPPST